VFKSTDGGLSWTASLNGLGVLGGWVKTLVVDPVQPSMVYAGTFEGFFRSTDGGHTWAEENLGLPSYPGINATTADPPRPGLPYVGTHSVVYQSFEGGQFFFWVPRNGTGANKLPSNVGAVTALALDPANPSVLYAGTESSGVFKTTDGGTAWAAASGGKSV